MQNERKQLAVWDVFVRLFHWCLLAAVIISFYTTKTDGTPFLFPIEVHAQAGYLIIGLLIFRVIWGISGPAYARFSAFIYGPKDTAIYANALLKRRAPRYASHNPLGGWMVVLLLLSLSFQAVSGLFLSDDIFFQGPLYGLLGRDISGELASLHSLNSDVLLILIGIHVAGIIVHALQGENLVAAMVTGIKHFNSEPIDIKPAHRTKHRLFALGAFLVAAGVCGWLWFYPY